MVMGFSGWNLKWRLAVRFRGWILGVGLGYKVYNEEFRGWILEGGFKMWNLGSGA